MDHDAIAPALIGWAEATIPDLGGSYDFPAEKRDQALPDVAAEVVGISYIDSDAEFSELLTIEQARLQVAQCEVILVTDPEPARDATRWLEQATQLLAAATLDGVDLQPGRIGRNFSFTFRPAFAEFDDGSRGRLATMNLRVASLIQ
jgi:hypothetical protein